MRCLSIKQPWSWLIVNGYKDIENRNWNTNFRGYFLIHASKTFDMDGYNWIKDNKESLGISNLPLSYEYELGGIVGYARIVDCVTSFDSIWFTGKYGFVIEDAKPLKFDKCKGQLKFFSIPVVWEEFEIRTLKADFRY